MRGQQVPDTIPAAERAKLVSEARRHGVETVDELITAPSGTQEHPYSPSKAPTN